MRQQQGMAVVMSLLLVALAASASALVLWQQGLWWHQLAADRRRAQIQALLDSERSWALTRLTMQNAIALSQPWAEPLRLSEPEYEMHGQLSDLQGRFNLNALASRGGEINLAQLAALRGLLAELRLPPSLADNLIRWFRLHTPNARRVPGTALARSLERWEMLAWVPGYTPTVMERLAPYSTVLPADVVTVNVNTAAPLLLRALLPQIEPGLLQRVLAQRHGRYFRDIGDFQARLGTDLSGTNLSATSSWFLLEATVRQGTWLRGQQAVLRLDAGGARVVWRHEPTASQLSLSPAMRDTD